MVVSGEADNIVPCTVGRQEKVPPNSRRVVVAHAALSSRVIWWRPFCKQVGDHPALGTISETEVSQNTSAVGLWCESTVGQQNSRDSQLSPVDDKLSLSIQSVAGFSSDLEFFPLFIIKQKAKEFHTHQPQTSWLESCCSLHYFSPPITS